MVTEEMFGLSARICGITAGIRKFNHSGKEHTSRAWRMSLIDRAYVQSRESVDKLLRLRDSFSHDEFVVVDEAVRAAWMDLEHGSQMTRPIDLDVCSDFFMAIEKFAQKFILDHGQSLREANKIVLSKVIDSEKD